MEGDPQRGLSRDFLCRLYVSICIEGYRCTEGPERTVARLPLSPICVDLYWRL